MSTENAKNTIPTASESTTNVATMAAKTNVGWYELRPFFEPADNKYPDMHEIIKRIKEFSFFLVRPSKADGVMQLYMHIPDASDAKVAQSALRNALMEPTPRKAFSASMVVYLKMRRHYAIPIAHELVPSLVYATMEKIGRPCFVAVTAKYHDESYQISQFAEKNLYDKPPVWRDILGMFITSFGSDSEKRNLKKHTAPEKLMLAELAKEKQQLRHFHCSIAIGSEEIGAARSIMKVLSESEGFALSSMVRDSVYRMEVVKKPVFFASHFCVLSDIELANIISLPDNPRIYRFNISRKETYTSGPSQAATGEP
ncbi:hypothetical protein NTE_03364 [Candidatus Nitrososphaera evergladensis SR1]|uniref:Uncharacterized protein n=1 Tax=Candidatus Nitrososphaera evergladensis SR1 TaxID=1459636 RepID=A0A075MXQ6_9ARCH|nr:hypothetical protein [Candidatus Nitrososphaera evergladensis]AIF85392.1 hypothetical protein NTE_03364 [Candidatus Nitrososphaera evergladensis SR1]